MKKLIFLFLLTFVVLGNFKVSAQENDRIYISVYQPDKDEITSEASKHLTNKMKNLILAHGISDEDDNNRFVITSKILVTTKDIVPSTPQRISEKIEFTFMIGDVIENKVFESVSISTVGVDINETKAMISAIKKINIKNSQFESFISNAKKKIESYYTERCNQILTQARQSAANRDFDNAIYQLMQVPSICDCAEECQNLEIELYQQRIDLNAEQLLNQAQSIWASSPTIDGASRAAEIIKQIPSGSSSQPKVELLISDIESKLKEDQRKEWAFKIQKYKDNIAREKREYALRAEQQKSDNEYRAKQQVSDNAYRAKQQASDNAYRAKQQASDNAFRANQQAANNAYRANQQTADNAARRQYIEACRQVGLEYAKNQPKTVVYRKNVILW
ncbi:MAG: hypothetical protein SOV38_07520 [Prevotella sp.]|nr:hypothetical protein [Prevotella sp.]